MLFLYAVLTAIASLNRETGLILVGLYAAFYGLAEWRKIVFLVVGWASITIALHMAFGAAPAQFGGFSGTLAMNMATLPSALFANVLLMPLWISAIVRWKGSRMLNRRLLICGGLYVMAFLVGAVYQEVRLLIVLFPLVLPVILTQSRVH